jgi:hypothetical protein
MPLILLYLIVLIIFGEYKLRSSSLCTILHPLITSSLLVQRVCSVSCCQTLSADVLLLWEAKFQTTQKTGIIAVFFCKLILTILNSMRQSNMYHSNLVCSQFLQRAAFMLPFFGNIWILPSFQRISSGLEPIGIAELSSPSQCIRYTQFADCTYTDCK